MSEILEQPRGGCVLSGAGMVLTAIDRVCPIYHSGPGCAMQTIASDYGGGGGKRSPFLSGVQQPSTNMVEKDVVFGGIDRLRTTVQGAIEVIDADAYFILTGCTAGIIGEDVKEVALEFRDKGFPVYAIDTPGFYGNDLLGYEVCWNNLIDQVIEPPVEKNPKLVNLFGIIPYRDPYWAGNLEEISRILSELGLEVNTFYTDGQNISNVRHSSEAALNIIVNPWLFKGPAEKFRDKFGVPFIRCNGLPIGATDTTAFVRQVADALNLDSGIVDKVIAKEEKYVYRYLSMYNGVLGWQKFAVVADANTAVGLTRYLANDFSFSPVITIVTEPMYRQEDADRITGAITQLEHAKPPKVLFEADEYRINEALRQADDIMLLLGSNDEDEIASELGIRKVTVSFPVNTKLILNRAIAGYRGSLTLTEDLR